VVVSALCRDVVLSAHCHDVVLSAHWIRKCGISREETQLKTK
jgi:hypothetical protein